MHIALVSFMVLGFIAIGKPQTMHLEDIRQDFNKGVKDATLCRTHWENLEKNAQTTVEKGYEAAYQMFMAKHTHNPIKKMRYFNSGKKLLEQQIAQDKNNTELRFIRLCIQYYIPDYLGYKSNIHSDKEFVMNNLHKMQDKKTKALIYKYLAGAKMYTNEELALLAR